MQVIEFLRDFFWIAYQPLLLIAAILAIVTWLFRIYNERKKKFLLKDEFAARFLEQYNSDEIRSAVSGYIKPHCSPGDPSNREGEEFLADLRESIFNYIDRSVSVSERSYNLILADTGMEKPHSV